MTETEYNDEISAVIKKLTNGEIDLGHFENLCKKAWVSLNGPVPDGRMLVVCITGDRLVVGHIENYTELVSSFHSLRWPYNAIEKRKS